MPGFGHLRPRDDCGAVGEEIASLAAPHGVSGACESDSDAKPPAAARTRIASGPYNRASGRDIVHQRPPMRLRALV